MLDLVTHYFDDIAVGMTGEFSKTVAEEDIGAFAEITGDRNPLHLDEAYAANTVFGGRIAHGILSAGYISAVFGTVFPGPGWIYVSQNLRFRAPVRIGDTVTAKVEVTQRIPEKHFVEFATSCSVGNKVVLEGTATLMSPKRAA